MDGAQGRDREIERAQALLASVESFEVLCQVVVSAARTLAAADGATFVARDGDRCFYVDEDAMAPLWKGQRFPINQCISGWAMLNADVAQIPNIRVDPRIPQDAYLPTFVRSLVSLPIGPPEPIGAIGVYWQRQGHVVDDATLGSLRSLAAVAEQAVRRLGLENAPWAPNFRLDRTPT
jgi:hypothetical protein